MIATAVTYRDRRTLLTVYDLLHLFTLEGPRVRRSVVVDYLARAGMSPRTRREDSRLRGFERLKAHLGRLSITWECEVEQHGGGSESVLVIRDAPEALARVSGLLDQIAAPQGDEDAEAA